MTPMTIRSAPMSMSDVTCSPRKRLALKKVKMMDNVNSRDAVMVETWAAASYHK